MRRLGVTTTTLAQQVKRIEQRIQPNRKREWRAYLEQGCFTEPQYIEHRAAIIDALCSDQPAYNFTLTDPETGEPVAFYMIFWPGRDTGDVPGVKSIHMHRGPYVHVTEGVNGDDV